MNKGIAVAILVASMYIGLLKAVPGRWKSATALLFTAALILGLGHDDIVIDVDSRTMAMDVLKTATLLLVLPVAIRLYLSAPHPFFTPNRDVGDDESHLWWHVHIFGPVCEELVFRHGILRTLLRGRHPLLAALLFALGHYQSPPLLLLTFLFFHFATCFLEGGLLSIIVVHVLCNAVGAPDLTALPRRHLFVVILLQLSIWIATALVIKRYMQ
jgi:membrane protease YdiL (CAAX protease family)